MLDLQISIVRSSICLHAASVTLIIFRFLNSLGQEQLKVIILSDSTCAASSHSWSFYVPPKEKIFQRQVAKEGLSNAVVDSSRMAADATKVLARATVITSQAHFFLVQARFTREELRDIFTYNEFTLCDTHELFGCECVVRRVLAFLVNNTL